MQKKQRVVVIITLILVSIGLFVVYRYQKSQPYIAPMDGGSPMPPVKWCDLPLHYGIIENDPTILKIIPWLTYENKAYHYKLDYPYILILNTDSMFPNVQFDNPPFSINVSVSSEEFSYYHGSLDKFLQKFAPTGMRLDKRIKIDGYDAMVISNENVSSSAS